jgi:GNAT superfamily N-acetyltransferase
LTYRQAALDDARDILPLLLRLAPEIPLLADTLEREEVLYALIRRCSRTGESWVALDAAGAVIGVALAEPTEHGRHYAEHEILEMHYAAVAPEHRDDGVLAALVGKIQARLVPVTTTVSRQNRFDLAAQLQSLGFRSTEEAGGEPRLRWDP